MATDTKHKNDIPKKTLKQKKRIHIKKCIGIWLYIFRHLYRRQLVAATCHASKPSITINRL